MSQAAKSERPALGTPRALGYRMPAEWAPHFGIWLAWPHDLDTFPDLPRAEGVYVELIRHLHSDEKVQLFVLDGEMQARASALLEKGGVDPKKILFYTAPYRPFA